MIKETLLAAVLISQVEFTPSDNKFSAAKAELGKNLFFDHRLSRNNTVSCSTCHSIQRAFTDGRRISVGINNISGTRNAPTLWNVGNQHVLFWDGRADKLEGQAVVPFNLREMGHSLQQATARVNQIPGYSKLVSKAFPESGGVAEQITLIKGLAAYQRTFVNTGSIAEKYFNGEEWYADKRQKKGLFTFKQICAQCHKPPFFRDESVPFANTAVASRFNEDEQGRFTIDNKQENFRAFKIPTLLEIQDTGPYFHAGEVDTLEGVLNHYLTISRGGFNVDSRFKPFSLTQEQYDDLIYTLKTAFKGKKKAKIVPPELLP